MAENNYQDIIEKDILELLGAGDMPEDKKRNLYTKMLETIQNRVIIKISKSLSEDDLKKWSEIVKSGNQVEMREFMESKNISIEEMMMKEALLYKFEMIELAAPIKKAYEEKVAKIKEENK